VVAPFGCDNGRSDQWGHKYDPRVGFAARDARYRYVAWMRLNATIDAVDWSRAPAAEELYDNARFDDRDLDSADLANLLAPNNHGRDAARAVADERLRWLREAARERHTRAFGAYAHRLHNDHPLVGARASLDMWKRDRSGDERPA